MCSLFTPVYLQHVSETSLLKLKFSSITFITHISHPCKPPEVAIVYKKKSDPTSKKTQRVSITKTSWLTLFSEIIAVYAENHMEPLNTLCGQNAE
jgi:hypothetical protein